MIFDNPVRVDWGAPDFSWLASAIGERRFALVTTSGAESRGVIETVTRALGVEKIAVTTSVQPNPTIASIRANAAELLEAQRDPELLVAIGGGSTLDTAKGIAAIASGGFAGDWFADHLRGGAAFPEAFSPPAIIAVPTTSGTGSEVTMWGTVWDEVTGDKYSISHGKLYAERAVLIPELTLSLSADLTLFTALDALSHCMESIWNRRSNAVSEAFAMGGISRIAETLSRALADLTNLGLRRQLSEGALLGGLAISSTATALAHSISYPLTSQLKMPHGLACSFTLVELMRFNGETAPDALRPIVRALGAENLDAAQNILARLFDKWGVRHHASRYVNRESASALGDRLLTPGRADNNVRPASHDAAIGIVLRSIESR